MITYLIGFLAQGFFSARTLLQWILSEKARKVLAPSIFWILSIIGSYLMFIYGWSRDDFSILLGQFISYYIYIWNLYEKKIWKKFHSIIKIILLITPIIAIISVSHDISAFIDVFIKNEKVPLWLLIFGSAGQIIFNFRFVYQLIISAKKKESILPEGFWILSLVGSVIILTYAIYRKDPVLIAGQLFGFIIYGRNIMIGIQYSKKNKKAQINCR